MTGEFATTADLMGTPSSLQPSRVRAVIDTLTTIVMLTVAGIVAWLIYSASSGSSRPLTEAAMAEIPLEGAPRLGNPSAPFVVVEFSDFECPYCRKFAQDVWPELKAKYVDTGTLQVSYRHLPLGQHPHAEAAAEAAVCADHQNRFWLMADALLIGEPALEDGALRRHALAAGLEMRPFEACLSGSVAPRVRQDVEMAQTLKVTGTPTFVIGRLVGQAVKPAGVLYGVVPVSQFEKAIVTLKGSGNKR